VKYDLDFAEGFQGYLLRWVEDFCVGNSIHMTPLFL
jgi:hypothetical protein